MTLLIASTVAPYKFQKPREETEAWLTHAEAWQEAGHEFFLAAELEAEWSPAWPANHMSLVNRLSSLDATTWTFMIDTGDRELTSGGRLVRICTGRNLTHEMFNRNPGRWEGILFLDTDVEPPLDAPERLLEVDRQLVGFNVPTYCMDGPKVHLVNDGTDSSAGFPWSAYLGSKNSWVEPTQISRKRPFPEGADIREHWNTAGALMVRSDAARRLRWRYDLSIGSTDDPCFQADAEAAGFGMTWVRHDVVGQHHPGMIYPLEARGHDLRI